MRRGTDIGGAACTATRLFALSVLLLCLPVSAIGRETVDGEPLVTRLHPDLDVYLQHFAIAEDDRSVLYLASHAGVLTYDGVGWHLLRMPNGDLARALAHDGQGRVYVGGFNTFGYIDRDATGRERYHDLATAVPADAAEFADIWQIVLSRHGVFFRALNHVFRLDPSTREMRVWHHDGRFGAMTQMGDDLLLQFRGRGLMRWADGDWVPAPGGEGLAVHAWALLPLDGDALLALSADGLWREYRRTGVTLRRMPQGFPLSSEFSDGLRLEDGSLALTGADGHVYLYDPDHGHGWRFRADHGYLAAIIRAADGGLLIAGEEAVMHVRWPAPWTVFGPEQGWTGALNDIVRWNGRWFALTVGGVFEIARTADGRPRFDRQSWTEAEVWSLLPLDARHALLADTYSVRLIDAQGSRRITDDTIYPRTLLRSRADPERVYVGTDHGVIVLQRVRGQWRVQHQYDEIRDTQVDYVVEREPGELWIGSARDGVRRLRYAGDHRSLIEVRRWTAADGLDYGTEHPSARLAEIGGELMVSTTAGLFRWSGAGFEPTALDGLGELRRPDEVLHLAQAPDGKRWAFGFNRIYRETGDGWQEERLGDYRPGMLQTLHFSDDGVALFSAARGLLRFDPRHAAANAAPPPRLIMRRAELRAADGTVDVLEMPEDSLLRLLMSNATLALHYSLPARSSGERVRYQTRLAGLEQTPSAWSDATSVSYNRLLPGRYRFEARARDAQGRISELPGLELQVDAPWYVSGVVRAVWLLSLLAIAALLMFALVRWRTGQLRLRAQKLEGMVAERTAALELANRRLDELAHLDGLTEIANRRRLDTYLEYIWERAAQIGFPLSLLAIDLDHFKRYNDDHGHLAGDELLKSAARAMRACLRKDNDLLARFGGDEFMAILPGATRSDAQIVAQRMRERVEALATGVTLSIGVAERRPQQGDLLRDLLAAADSAVYAAKAAGRNRVAFEPAPA